MYAFNSLGHQDIAFAY